MNIIFLLSTAILTLLMTFLTGFMSLRALTNLSTKECWAFSGIAGCTILAFIAFNAFLVNNFDRLFYIIPLISFLILCLVILKLRNIPGIPERPPRWSAYIFIFWIILVFFQLLTPVYTGAGMYGDWWMHYDIALFFRGLRPLDVQYFGLYGIPSRTPLYNLFASYFLAVFGNQFAVYQMITIIPGIALIGTSLIFIRKKIVALLFLFLNPFLVSMMLYPWPKILATNYILCAIYFYIRWQNKTPHSSRHTLPITSGFLQGLAILTHPSALFYSLGIIIDNIIQRRFQPKQNVQLILLIGIPMVIVFLPWFLWIIDHYSLINIISSSPVNIGNAQVLSSEWLWARAVNLVATLISLPALIALKLQNWYPLLWQNIWLRFYYSVLPGTLTITVSLILWRYLRKKYAAIQGLRLRTLGIICLTGFLCGIIFQPGVNPNGLVGESMTPIVIIALLVGSQLADTFTLKQQQRIMLFCSVEFMASRGFQTIKNFVSPILKSDNNMLLKNENHLVFANDLGRCNIASVNS